MSLLLDDGSLRVVCGQLLTCDPEAEGAKYYCPPFNVFLPGEGQVYPLWVKMPCTGTMTVSGLVDNGASAGFSCADVPKTSPSTPAADNICSYYATQTLDGVAPLFWDLQVTWFIGLTAVASGVPGIWNIRANGSYGYSFNGVSRLGLSFRKDDLFTGIDEEDCVCLDFPDEVELDWTSTTVGGDLTAPCGPDSDKSNVKLTFNAD